MSSLCLARRRVLDGWWGSVLCSVLATLGCDSTSPNHGDGGEPPAVAGSGGSDAAGIGGGAPAGTSGVSGGAGAGVGGAGSVAGAAGSTNAAGNSSAGTSGGASAGTTSGGTGGVAGTAGGPAVVDGVAFSVPSQAFEGQLAVALSTTLANAEIHYTQDRTLPTLASALYANQPLTISATAELRAQAFVAGVPTGPVGIAIYILREFDASSDIPLVIVDGFGLGEPTDQDVFVDAAVMVFEPQNGEAKLSNLPTIAAHAGWHVRGQSSASFPKTPYRVELRDAQGEDVDYPLLGMPADSDWALIPPYTDRSLMRNPFVYELGREMGMTAPRVKFAEVYVNHAQRAVQSDDYAGVYWVTETIKNSKDRLNLQQLRETDTTLPAISGGYIMKFDWNVSEEPTLPCTGSPPSLSEEGAHCWTDLEVVDPDPLVPEQAAWITDYVQRLHDSLQTTPLGDYAAMMNVPSFVDYFIISELTRNLDAYTRSAYYHKDRDGVLTAGPLWDYNYALDAGRATNRNAEGWQYLTEPQTTREGGSNWIPRLASDPAFMALVSARWKELRRGVLADAALETRVMAMTAPLTAAAERDLVRWPVDSNMIAGGGPSDPTWSGQVQAILTWLVARTTWLDAQFP
jgi:hypothetical protein